MNGVKSAFKVSTSPLLTHRITALRRLKISRLHTSLRIHDGGSCWFIPHLLHHFSFILRTYTLHILFYRSHVQLIPFHAFQPLRGVEKFKQTIIIMIIIIIIKIARSCHSEDVTVIDPISLFFCDVSLGAVASFERSALFLLCICTSQVHIIHAVSLSRNQTWVSPAQGFSHTCIRSIKK